VEYQPTGGCPEAMGGGVGVKGVGLVPFEVQMQYVREPSLNGASGRTTLSRLGAETIRQNDVEASAGKMGVKVSANERESEGDEKRSSSRGSQPGVFRSPDSCYSAPPLNRASRRAGRDLRQQMGTSQQGDVETSAE
jgi:hypothetical protein